ncbi:MAG: glycosyltransferase family 39 protein [Leadbetterella sp.]|nr:glycosyltransferase family 39 protein [Leadbetterella sp.]
MKKYILLFLLAGIALGLRLYRLDARGLITDEKFTLVNSNGFWVGGANQSAFRKDVFTAADFWEKKGIQDYMDATAHADFGTHIVHNAVMHYWMKIFGNSDFSVRLPGALFNVITVLLLFLMVLKYFGSYRMAFLAGLLLAVDPLNVAQSHIARSYPLSFFLILLSTEYFIRIVREGGSAKNFIIYALLTGLSMLNHYINFFVPLVHIVAFLALRNKAHLWRGFIAAAVFNAALLFYWFNWGGGYTAMDFLKDKNELHRKIAENEHDELSGTIQKATPELIAKKAIGLYYDITVLGHGLFEKIKGVRVFLSSFLFFWAVMMAIRYKKNPWIRFGSVGLALLILALQMEYITGILVSGAIFAILYFGWQALRESYALEAEKGRFVLLLAGFLLLILPILFVVNDAFTNGNTTSLTHRYIGNASPFVVILIAVGMVRAADFRFSFLLWMAFAVIVQAGSIRLALKDYFADRSVYNAWFQPARVSNPYKKVAGELMSKAMPGDTIVIPGAYRDKYEERFRKNVEISYKDAQFLNLYFPKDFILPQVVDPREREKLYLKRKNGEKVLIFDFKGEEYRY